MKGVMMKTFALSFIFVSMVAVCFAETGESTSQTREPDLFDHFMAMEQTQERLSRLSPEEQERLEPQIRQAERRACKRLRKDRQEGVRDEDYRRQGGVEFLGYVLQFDKYCETIR